MKKSSFVWIALGVATISQAQLVGRWTFDEASGTTAFDSAAAVNGTLVNGVARVPGISGGAVELNRIANAYVTMGNNFGFLGTDYSISFWMKSAVGDSLTDQILVGKHEAGTHNGYFVGMNGNSGYGTTNKLWGYQSSSPGNQPTSTTNGNDGAWHHTVVTYTLSNGLHRIYVDGNLEDVRGAAPVNPNGAPFLVGGVNFSGTPGALTNCIVDELQLYTKPLNDAEVRYLHSNPGGVVPEPSTWLALGAGSLLLLRRRKR